MNVRIFEFSQEISTKKNEKGDYEVVDWVEYGPKDDLNTRTRATVKSLIPPDHFDRDNAGVKEQHMTYMWAQIEPGYNAWKDGVELPETGTPLGGWAALNKGTLTALQREGFKSVEDVRDMPESMMGKIRVPGVRALVSQAATFLDGQDKAAMAKAADEQNSKIAGLEEKLEAAMAMLEEQSKPAKRTKAAA